MRVIASSLRKGNILDLDGQLYVVLNAESFHPGKGTPTTQVDMRRISDGVKTQQRYKTTEQVERATVEEREYQFLYQDGDGFHFMNMENYEQVTMQSDVIGDQAAYLHPEMKVMLSMHEGTPISIVLPQKVVLEVTDQKISDEIKPVMPRVMDAFQTFLREMRPSDLEGSAGLYRLRDELTRRVNLAVAPNKINAVLFKEIIVQ